CATAKTKGYRPTLTSDPIGARGPRILSSKTFAADDPLNFRRGFVQPWNANNPPLRSGLSTFLLLLGVMVLIQTSLAESDACVQRCHTESSCRVPYLSSGRNENYACENGHR